MTPLLLDLIEFLQYVGIRGKVMAGNALDMCLILFRYLRQPRPALVEFWF
jgi:hypothetical protein